MVRQLCGRHCRLLDLRNISETPCLAGIWLLQQKIKMLPCRIVWMTRVLKKNKP
jgi:hypothetical protein